MLLFYNFCIRLYLFVIYLASYFNDKAKLWFYGRRNLTVIRTNDSIWFHFASLGEFEQGRSVLEQVKSIYPASKIIITFFSPSGYEVRKNTPLADAVYYLPLDTKKNAIEFIEAIQPRFAVFTKYEYWYHFFNQMHQRQLPVYVISGIFRPGQVFFKWYGGLHRKMLGFVSYFFVQNDQSQQLLGSLGFNNIQISGDTRFDRVWQNAQTPKPIALAAEFKGNSRVFIAGSTWPADEKLIASLTGKLPGWKFIIAPHEITEEKINDFIDLLPDKEKFIRFSKIENDTLSKSDFNVLIIDNIGMLSSLYQYGDIAYIGGGFGAGIHNTLEAAAFGLPVIFGPNYAKFKEAHDLIELQAGFCINEQAELSTIAQKLANDSLFYTTASKRIKNYVKENTGATDTIIAYITQHNFPLLVANNI